MPQRGATRSPAQVRIGRSGAQHERRGAGYPQGLRGPLASLPPDTLPWLRKAGAKANNCNQEQGIGAGPAVHDAWERGEQNAVGPTAAPARGEGVPCWTAPGGRAAGGSSDPLRGRAAGAVRRRGPASAQRVGVEMPLRDQAVRFLGGAALRQVVRGEVGRDRAERADLVSEELAQGLDDIGRIVLRAAVGSPGLGHMGDEAQDMTE